MKKHKLAITLPLLAVLLVLIPALTMGVSWVKQVGLLSADAVVFSSDAPAIDRFMAKAMEVVYDDRIAVCDGTADQVEIQAAIDAFPSTGGKLVLSSGSYYDNASIEIPQTGGYSYISIMGQGPSTILRSDPADAISDHFIKCASEAARNMYVDLQNFRITGTNQAANGTSDSSGVKLWGSSYSHISNLTIQSCYKHGIWLACDAGTAAIDFRVMDCKLSANGGGGVYLDDSNTDVTVMGCNIYDNTGNGIYVGGAGGVIIEGNRLYNQTLTNINTNGMWTQIIGNNISGNSYCVLGGSNADRSIIQGNVCQYSSTYGVRLQTGCDNCVVTGNHFYDNDSADVYDEGSSNQVYGNSGDWVTENTGTGTLGNGETSVVISHGMAATPTYIGITWREDPTNAIADWWISAENSTAFTLNGADPGASALNFWWTAEVR